MGHWEGREEGREGGKEEGGGRKVEGVCFSPTSVSLGQSRFNSFHHTLPVCAYVVSLCDVHVCAVPVCVCVLFAESLCVRYISLCTLCTALTPPPPSLRRRYEGCVPPQERVLKAGTTHCTTQAHTNIHDT